LDPTVEWSKTQGLERRLDYAALAMDDATRRWLSAFANRRRAIPPNAETLESCPLPALEVARIIWYRRVVNEARSVELAQQMQSLGKRLRAWNDVLHRALERLAEDETSHVDLATAVLKRLQSTTTAIPEEAKKINLLQETPITSFMRLNLTGLCICESISASRFASVREHTDLDGYRACIELFYRDELTHAELGFVLLPHILEEMYQELGSSRATELIHQEMSLTFGHMDRVVGLHFERQGGTPPPRPQPKQNPGIVEPAVDAAAFYRSIYDDVVPRLEALGLPAQDAWKNRREN
jgi:hypothetical protein